MAGKTTMSIGDRYGMLTVIGLIPDRKNPIAMCVCECGAITKTQRGALRSGKAKSCGCYTRTAFAERSRLREKMPEEEARRRRNQVTIEWQKNNREKYRAKMRAWFAKNKDKVRASNQKRREAKKAYDAEYRIRNKERLAPIRRLNDHKRRLRTKAAIGVVSPGIVEKLMASQNNRCVVCRCDLHKSGAEVDHIIPIARGGKHDDSNFQLLCPFCNRSKGAKDPVEFMQQKGFLL